MGIRFYVPLPGPFAYVPGRNRPKQRANSESITSVAGDLSIKAAAKKAQRVYDDAHDFAVSKGLDDPDRFVDATIDQAKTEYIWSFGFGLVATIIFWFTQMGFGVLALALIPVINIMLIGIPAYAIGYTIADYLHRGDRLHHRVSEQLGYQTQGAHRAPTD